MTHGMDLTAFCQLFQKLDFPRRSSADRPPRDHVRAVQSAAETALQSDAFMADCIGAELRRLEREHIRGGLTPFRVVSPHGIRLAFGHWAPHRGTGPHEHTDWTVTAVCHNRLDVSTFDSDVARLEGRLQPKNLFPAPAGRAGHIYEPCIHEPRNPTSAWALSFHVLSPRDGATPSEEFRAALQGTATSLAPLDQNDPTTRCLKLRHREQALRLLADVTSKSRDPRTATLLDTIFSLGSARTRREVARVVATLPSSVARRCLAASEHRPLDGHTHLSTDWEPPPLEVRVHDGVADLVAVGRREAIPLLRVEAWAESALRALARERDIIIGELPGGLDDDEQIGLVEILQEWGLFTKNLTFDTARSPRAGFGAFDTSPEINEVLP